MNPPLSDQPTWFEPTAKLRALDDKSVRIKEADGEWVAKLAVDDADPRRECREMLGEGMADIDRQREMDECRGRDTYQLDPLSSKVLE